MKEKSIKIRVAVIVQKENAVLMIRHQKAEKTYWLLPGGGLEFGETITGCAVRELMEETGLCVRPGNLLFVCESLPPDGHRHVLNLFLHAELLGGELALGDEEILAEARFVPMEEIPSLTIHPPIKSVLLDYLRSGKLPAEIMLGSMWD
ncbi:MAG TPA: NUDIX domain-containing protein [bacterium]|nr:NUDIX domain-containing protein [bacterium]